MGDRKPKKNSSGNSDAHKAKQSSDQANRPMMPKDAKDQGKKK
jgi:hypothetical protein